MSSEQSHVLTRRQLFSRTARLFDVASTHPAEPVDPVISTTPIPDFFRVLRPTPPLQAEYWSFTLGGLVQHPLTWSYADLLAYPPEELACTLLCAAHTAREPRIGHAVWGGVALGRLLAEADIAPDARHANLHGADGHTTTISLDKLRESLLALTMNGETLPPEQGFPARLIVPGLPDHKGPRWLTRADLTADPTPGLWETRGWPDTVQPTVVLMYPPDRAEVAHGHPISFSGVAFAGSKPITALDIRIDAGDPLPLPFTPSPPNVWTPWSIQWRAPTPGDYRITLRPNELDAAQTSYRVRVVDEA